MVFSKPGLHSSLLKKASERGLASKTVSVSTDSFPGRGVFRGKTYIERRFVGGGGQKYSKAIQKTGQASLSQGKRKISNNGEGKEK